MVYAPKSALQYAIAPQQSPDLPDPQLLRVARQIYHAYLEVHARRMRRPFGVAIHSRSYRGLLIFSARPILLPGERFIPFEQIESELH
ncbi:MAG: hypothetical protein ACP5D7_17015 [Limnospira sp.]